MRTINRIVSGTRAAHAGSEHQGGINAVVELGALLPRVAALTNYERGVTVNVAFPFFTGTKRERGTRTARYARARR